VASDVVEVADATEYVLEAVLDIGALGVVGGASFAGTGGLLLNDRRDTLEEYPLSAFASSFGASSLGPFEFFFSTPP